MAAQATPFYPYDRDLPRSTFLCSVCLPPLCSWSLQKGYVPLPKSNHVERQRANLDVFRCAGNCAGCEMGEQQLLVCSCWCAG